MPLPDTPAFNGLLGSFTLREPASSDGFHFRTCLADEDVTDQGTRMKLPGLVLWWKADDAKQVTPEALVRKIDQELRNRALPLNIEAIWCLLAIYALQIAESNESAANRFNLLFDCIKPADLNQYRIQHSLVDFKWKLDLGEFQVAPINKEQIHYRCRKAGSNFSDLYLRFIPNHATTISHKPRRIMMLDQALLADAWGTVRNHEEVAKIERLFNGIAASVSQHYFTIFDDEFEAAQEILTAMGAGFIGVKNYQHDPHQYTWLSVFLMVEGKMKGWVSPAMIGSRTIEFGRPDVTLRFAQQVWCERLGMSEVRNHPAKASFNAYAHFVFLAQMHHRSSRHNEAFLHLVIALDLLLGSKESSTESVSKRTAIIVFRGLNQSFHQMVRHIKTLYDARSRYVHAGQEVEGKLWTECERICREVAIAYVAAIVAQKAGFAHEKWLKQLDLLVAQQDLGAELPAVFSAEAGLSGSLRVDLFDRGFSEIDSLITDEVLP